MLSQQRRKWYLVEYKHIEGTTGIKASVWKRPKDTEVFAHKKKDLVQYKHTEIENLKIVT